MSLTASYLYPRATVTRIVDGDTIHAEVDVGFRMKGSFKFRLYEYEAPEMKGTESRMGRIAAAALARIMPVGTVVTLYSFGEDDFGRWLVRIILADGTDVTKTLVSAGYGKFRAPNSSRPSFDGDVYPPS